MWLHPSPFLRTLEFYYTVISRPSANVQIWLSHINPVSYQGSVVMVTLFLWRGIVSLDHVLQGLEDKDMHLLRPPNDIYSKLFMRSLVLFYTWGASLIPSRTDEHVRIKGVESLSGQNQQREVIDPKALLINSAATAGENSPEGWPSVGRNNYRQDLDWLGPEAFARGLGEARPHLRFWPYGQPGHCRPHGRWVGWTASTRWSLPHVLEPPSRCYGDPESVLRLWGVASPEQQED